LRLDRSLPLAGCFRNGWMGVKLVGCCLDSSVFPVNVFHRSARDDVPPKISEPWQDPLADNVQPFQNVTVWVNVTDYGTGVKNATLWYSLDNGTSWIILNMTELPIPSDTTVTYEATIPGHENCTWITYKIVAYDKAGNNQTKDNEGYGYKYHVIPEFPSITLLLVLTLTTFIATILLKKRKKTKLQLP